jgi:hypothetical protein
MDDILARIQQREEATVKRERAMAYAFNHQVCSNYLIIMLQHILIRANGEARLKNCSRTHEVVSELCSMLANNLVKKIAL